MNFVRPLFDLSFSNFITSKVIGVLYALSLGLFALMFGFGYLVMVVGAPGFFATVGVMILGLPMAVLAFGVMAALTRIWFEMIIVLFRIAENVQLISTAKQKEQAAVPGTVGF